MEHPIMFGTPMIGALLAGRKTQTRRLLKYQPTFGIHGPGWWHHVKRAIYRSGLPGASMCRYRKGDRLWVRETWMPDVDDENSGIRYAADGSFIVHENTREASDRWLEVRRPEEQWPDLKPAKWRSPIFMPRWASRIILEVTGVRLERLQDISREDALAEGIYHDFTAVNCEAWGWEPFKASNRTLLTNRWDSPQNAYRALWDSINGKKGPWASNPGVWVIEFKVLSTNGKVVA